MNNKQKFKVLIKYSSGFAWTVGIQNVSFQFAAHWASQRKELTQILPM